jgi:repressor of nif and glnA expression
LHPLKESERKIMTKGLENLAESSEKEKINALFEQCIKEMRYLRNFSEHTLKGCRRVFNHWIYVGQMPTEQNLSRFVIEMRTVGLNTTTSKSKTVSRIE